MHEIEAAEPRWLNAEERRLWLRFRTVIELLPTALDAQLGRDAGLTEYEYYVLAMLSETPGHRMRMSQLAANTAATLPRLSRVVKGLEQRELVTRHPVDEDRRAIDVQLEDEGFQLITASAPGHLRAVRELVIDPIATEHFQAITMACDAMLRRLDPKGDRLAGVELAAGGMPDDVHPLPRLAAPAARALRDAGYTSLESVAGRSVREIAKLHGVGARALRKIDETLIEYGLPRLRDDDEENGTTLPMPREARLQRAGSI